MENYVSKENAHMIGRKCSHDRKKKNVSVRKNVSYVDLLFCAINVVPK